MNILRSTRLAITVIAPLAVLAAGCGSDQGDDNSSPDAGTGPTTPASSTPADPTSSATPAPDPTDGVDYVAGRTWHQADGDEVEIPKGDYYEAAIWDDQLVTIQPGGEVLGRIAIWDQNGQLVDSVDEAVGFAVSPDQTILAYTNGEGDLIARWDGGQSTLAQDVIDTGGGESVGGAPVAVTGTAPCEPESGDCLVRINTYDNGCRGIGSSDVPAPVEVLACGDEQDDLLVYATEYSDAGYQCEGIGRGPERALLWPAKCDQDLQDISPDGTYVIGGQYDTDGLGPKLVSVLDVETGEVVSTYTVPTREAFLWSDITWSTTGQLLVSQYDDGAWHLLALDPTTGEPTEIAGPVDGADYDNPFLQIHH